MQKYKIQSEAAMGSVKMELCERLDGGTDLKMSFHKWEYVVSSSSKTSDSILSKEWSCGSMFLCNQCFAWKLTRNQNLATIRYQKLKREAE